MRREQNGYRLSASDLASHLACAHLTQLERSAADGDLERPHHHDARLEILRQRGLEHEAAYIASLRATGMSVVAPAGDGDRLSLDATRTAMREGADAVVQAQLARPGWLGFADVLLRVDRPSDLGAWSYEVVDTKLAQDTRAGTILQLCLYADLLEQEQGVLPERLLVVKPGSGFPAEEFRTDEFIAYYRLARRRIENALAEPGDGRTYPLPVEHCSICRWWKHCDERRRADDHLCLVAGLSAPHSVELNRQGIKTMEQFADAPAALSERPERGSAETYERLQRQAQVQIRSRRSGTNERMFRPIEPGRGLSALPEPSPGDVFFDIEAAHFAADGGIEYLFGYTVQGQDGDTPYEAIWALSRSEERRGFEQFIDFVMARWRRFEGMHVYHYAPYEPAALKRLVLRYPTREAELDQLLRGRRFVDLHAVTRQALWLSVESYSLKDVERHCGFTRAIDVRSATAARRRVECLLEGGPASQADLPGADREAVEAYNLDDCAATATLRDWLEDRRAELEQSGADLPRPTPGSGDASEATSERDERLRAVFDALTERLPDDRAVWSTTDRARWLLAHLAGYFRREDKCAYWEFFRMLNLEADDLLEERKALFGIEYLEEVEEGSTPACPVHRYRFPAQEVALKSGDTVVVALSGDAGQELGDVAAMDDGERTIDIKKRRKAADLHPPALVHNGIVGADILEKALLEIAEACAGGAIDAAGPYRAARDLLMKCPPRLAPDADPPPTVGGETALQEATRLAQSLDSGVLAIQGPPGTGKTYTGSHVIAALAQRGARIGVTAVSHKVIRNLLHGCARAAADLGTDLRLVHKCDPGDDGGEVEEVGKAAAAIAEVAPGSVVGGTAWLWASDNGKGLLDYLFIDEAGQMSMAVALAASRAAKNIILLGDPQQLEQPQRGAHPEGADVSALEHLLDGHKTMPKGRGLFLAETWRMHPDVCRFTSKQYYEGRLRSRAGLERQSLIGTRILEGPGGLYVSPVEHEGNQSRSLEEVEAVAAIVDGLLTPTAKWVTKGGEEQPLGADDILIVAPYNAQVEALSRRLPEMRVGTVDKFQGQEAPVVIYSMASSSAEDAPRGLGFLYDPHRTNVATSRARVACVLVASPRVFEPECRSPEQMRWANGLCRYRELATEI